MKKTLILSVFIASCMFLFIGCEKDGDDSHSPCSQLVNFTINCYQEVERRTPSQQEVDNWRASCSSAAYTTSCIDCAMEQSCDDYLPNSDYVYNTLCADPCRCSPLVNFTITCYEEVVGRAPSQQDVDNWRAGCNSTTNTISCSNCAMEQSCDDYLLNPDYVFNTLCADRCP